MMGALNGWIFKDEKSVSFITHFSKEGNSDEFQNLTMSNSTIISKEDEIFLPLRDSIVVLGKTISWDSKTKEITVTGKITY